MKIVNKGKVFDLDYGNYTDVCDLPAGWRSNEVGNDCPVTCKLRRDDASGLFYVLTSNGGYGRSSVNVATVSESDARILAEKYLDYADFCKVFGDPEGVKAECDRRVADLNRDLKSAKDSSESWYSSWSKRGDEIDRLNREIESLKARLGNADTATDSASDPF